MTKKKRVLLCIERSPEKLQRMKETLEALGYSVLTAWSGGQGRDVFLKHAGRIESVLVARELPDAGGDVIAEEIRRLKPQVPVLLACHDLDEWPAVRPRFSGRRADLRTRLTSGGDS